MRLWRCLCLVFFCAVICCGLFSVFASAAVVEQYSYNGVVLPKLPETSCDIQWVLVDEDGSYFLHFADMAMTSKITGAFSYEYILVDGLWKEMSGAKTLTLIWSNRDVVSSGNILIAGSDPVITYIEVPDPPPTIEDFLSGAAQIFTSATAWISSFTGFIMDHPLVLFAALLGVCGIGIGLIERLRKQRR